MIIVERLFEAAERNARATDLEAPPGLGVVIVTCMDARIDPDALFGLERGDAQILRNAGGIVTEDVLRGLIISEHVHDTRRVIVLQHTGCGLIDMDEHALRETVLERCGTAPTFGFGRIEDLDQSVCSNVARVRGCPWFPQPPIVVGAVYDLANGAVRIVDDGTGVPVAD